VEAKGLRSKYIVFNTVPALIRDHLPQECRLLEETIVYVIRECVTQTVEVVFPSRNHPSQQMMEGSSCYLNTGQYIYYKLQHFVIGLTLRSLHECK